jgi:ATP-dependent Clp protease ATP-binding subunit ClpC
MSMSTHGFGSSDPFGELLNRFFGMSPASSPPAVQRVPIGRLLTESSQELLNLAAQRAMENGVGVDPGLGQQGARGLHLRGGPEEVFRVEVGRAAPCSVTPTAAPPSSCAPRMCSGPM